MLKRHQDQVYFLCVRFINFFLTKEHLKQIGKNSYVYGLISRESVSPMFISELADIAKFDSPVKCFIYNEKISLSDHMLYFSVKLSDLNPKNSFFIKVFHISNHVEAQIASFKFFINKYVEVQQLEGKKHSEDNFFDKNGARLQTEVFIENNRAVLQMLILDVNEQKKKRRSLNARKKKEEKKSLEKSGNGLTIEKPYQVSQEQKNLVKTMQRAQMKKATQGLKRKKSNSSILSSEESSSTDPQASQAKLKTQLVQETQKRDKSLITSRKVNDKHNLLDISRISEVINSENGSDPQKGNILESFYREREKTRGSEYRKKSESSDPILEKLDFSKPNTKKALSVTEQIAQDSSIFTGKNKILTQEATAKESIHSISSIEGQYSESLSRSFTEAVELDSEDSMLTHSSESSARSQLEHLKQKRNKLFWILLIGFAAIAIFFLIIPKSTIKRAKPSSKREKYQK